jgi:spoIIIJ-associated protein
MEWIEVAARTIAEAKELALDRLGVVEDELEFEVLQAPKSGILGIGRSDARIRARVMPLSREKPADRRRRSRAARSRDARKTRAGSTGRGEDRSTAGAARGGDATASGGNAARPSRNRRRRSGSRASGGGTGAVAIAATPEEEAGTVEHSDVSVEEQAAAAKEFTSGLLEAFDVDAAVSTSVGEDLVEVEIEGSDLGLLVGPKGATLAAIEELVRAVVQHATSGQSARINVDVAGYRQRRREALAEFTRKLAQEVVSSGEQRALEPMSPPDRKVVHDTVAELAGVSTVSEGEEPRRRVVIRPD